MKNIKRVSLFFRIIFQTLLVGLPTLLVIAWFTDPSSLVLLHGLINLSFIPQNYMPSAYHGSAIMHVFNLPERIIGLCIGAIPTAIEMYFLYSLVCLFKLYEKGEIFSAKNVQYIRASAYALLLVQIINPIYESIMGIFLTWRNPPGHHFFAITVDQTNLGLICLAILILLISWVMAEGARLNEEQQLTV